MKFPSFLRLFGERWQRAERRGRRRARRPLRPANAARLGLEALEDRTLLTTVPQAIVSSWPNLGNFAPGTTGFTPNTANNGNFSSPTVVQDPLDANKMVAVYVRDDPVHPLQNFNGVAQNVWVEGQYSINGGQTWTTFLQTATPINPQSSPMTPTPLPIADSPSAGFDRGQNFYVVFHEHTTDQTAGGASAGYVVLNKFDFRSTVPVRENIETKIDPNNSFGGFYRPADKLLYAYANADPVLNLTLTVDNNLPSFTDPTTGQVQTDVNAGAIYVAWNTNQRAPTGAGPAFSPNVIKVVASSDGGLDFSSPVSPGDGGNFPGVNARFGFPQLSVSQGTAHNVGQNARVTGGQLNVVWDNFNATTNVPDTVRFDRAPSGGGGAEFSGIGGTITDAVTINNVTIPGITNYPVQVDSPLAFLQNVSDIQVWVSMLHPSLGDLTLQLVPPNGLPTVLLAAGGTGGISGANMGVVNTRMVPTVFDDNAARFILDTMAGASAPYASHFQPFGSLSSLAAAVRANPAAAQGQWNFRITDGTASNQPAQDLFSWTLQFARNLNFGGDITAATVDPAPTILTNRFPGNFTTPFSTTVAASPDLGLAAMPVVASDNTLGSFSPNQGRIYVAYTGPKNGNGLPLPPTDATDIFLSYSDNGGTSWTGPVRVNSDQAIVDGYSEANDNPFMGRTEGRPHFLPSLAVDNTTGNVFVSFYDASQDAARVRVARTIAISNDGGNTFDNGLNQLQTFLNPPNQVLDAITGGFNNGTFRTLGPEPDNFGTSNAARDTTYSYGTKASLIVNNGKVTAAWAGNRDGLDGGSGRIDILGAQGVVTGGPRIIDSTMGPVKPTTVLGFTFNNTTTADGTPLLDGFVLVFDRKIDRSTFTASAVTVMYHDTVAGTASVPVTVLTPVALDADASGGATTFFVPFDTPQSMIGTYSYAISPTMSDRLRRQPFVIQGGSVFNQAATAPAVPATIPAMGMVRASFTVPATRPPDEVIVDANVNVTLNHPSPSDLQITLIAPDGSRIPLLSYFSLFGPVNGTLTFDDQGAPGHRIPLNSLRALNGKSPIGTWTLEILVVNPGNTGTLQGFSIDFTTQRYVAQTTVSGNQVDQNANGTRGQASQDRYQVPAPVDVSQAPFTGPYRNDTLPLIVPGPSIVDSHVPNVYAPARSQLNVPIPPVGTGGTGDPTKDVTFSNLTVSGLTGNVTFVSVNVSLAHTRDSDLKISLVAPNGTEILLSNRHGGTGANYTNTDFDDTAAVPIGAGSAPFTGRFRPDQALSTLNGLTGTNLNGVWKLKIEDTAAGESGTLLDWSLTIETTTTQATGDNLVLNNSARFLDVTFDRDMNPSTFTPADVQQFIGPAGLVSAPKTYVSTDVNRSIPDDVIFNGKPTPLNSLLTIPDSYVIGDLNVAISLTHPHLRDLSAFLIGPDGTKVELFQTPGQDRDFDLTNTVIDESAAAGLGAGVPPFTGTFRPARTYAATGLPQQIPDNVVVNGQQQELVSNLTINDSFTISQLSVRLSISHNNVSDLTVYLEAPDGTKVQLFANVGANGHDFVDTSFDDQATVPINLGQSPFTGLFKPAQPLGAFAGKNIQGVWKLHVVDTHTGTVGTLNAWSISATSTTPSLSVFNGKRITGNWQLQIIDNVPGNRGTLLAWALIATPVGLTVTANPPGTPAALAQRRFRIGFPAQDLSGTYSVTIGSAINASPTGASAGAAVDANQNAGVDVLGLDSTAKTGSTPVRQDSTDVPMTLLPGGTIDSRLTFADDFVITGATLQLDITDPNDPDLSATLIAPDGVTRIQLFSQVGTAAPPGQRQNFSGTIFDDASQTPITQGAPPFSGRFAPMQSLTAALNNMHSVGPNPWILEVKDLSGTAGTRRLNSWSLTLSKAVVGSGLGEAVADRSTVSFRIFTMDQANPLSSSAWTAVGPASTDNTLGVKFAGSITAIAVDPSDPSGNTVYVGGASGGVWKTTNFLTSDPKGPTYLPLTDFGPTSGLNIGGLAVFGRNQDPNQSIIFAATGNGNDESGPGAIRTATGVGFLRSMDGGATWTLLDSTVNVDSAGNPLPLSDPRRDHVFAFSTTAFKVVVDPRPTPGGEVIAYAALSGPNGGIYRTTDTGKTWQLMRAGQATDVILDPASNYIDAVANPTGNIQNIYGAFRGEGVFVSFNRGQVWNKMLGTAGVPLIQDVVGRNPIPVTNLPNPNSSGGRIVLGKPSLTGVYLPDGTYTGNRAEDVQYQSWLYAMVVGAGGTEDGLYLTKDNGNSWTKLQIPAFTVNGFSPNSNQQDIPSNNAALPGFDVLNGGFYQPGIMGFQTGNYHVSLAVDPNNPNITYVGGTTGNTYSGENGPTYGLIKVDSTGVADAHAFYFAYDRNDGGILFNPLTDPVTRGGTLVNSAAVAGPDADPFFLPVINLLRRPGNPFSDATLLTTNTGRLSNSGDGVKWVPFDAITQFSTNQHTLVTIRDPLTGKARLILGDDQGVFTGVDNGDPTLDVGVGGSVGRADAITGDRNGNLQTAQFYYGAVQPSDLATQLATLRASFYGSTLNNGFPESDPNVLTNGNLTWVSSIPAGSTPLYPVNPGALGSGGGIATDQTGRGTVYSFRWPCCGGDYSNFFAVNNVARTQFLLQQSNPPPTIDPQWPYGVGFNFAVNPVNNQQIILSSATGQVFESSNTGVSWGSIGSPTLDGTNAAALAYGAPQPNDPVGSLNNFLYAGTLAGNIFVTFTGGGANGNQWRNISTGLDRSPVRAIATNPLRGSRDAYAVTDTGVFFMADSGAQITPTWVNITGNLFSVMHTIFQPNNADGGILSEAQLQVLSTLTADWRYVIPDNPSVPNGPTHPVLYVGGLGGVYRSFDKGQTWALFPNLAVDAARQDGGYLPNAQVTDLDLALGNIDPTTGKPKLIDPNAKDANGNTVTATGPAVLLASTFGRGAFAIRIAPTVVPGSVMLDPNNPAPGGSDTGVSNNDGITSLVTPFITGLSAQSAFGNSVTVRIYDVTDPTRPPIFIGVGNTDQVGRFSVQINTGANGGAVLYLPDGSTDGLKRLAVQTTDDQGTVSPFAYFDFTLDTTPFVRVTSLVLSAAAPTTTFTDPETGQPRTFVGSDSVQDPSNPAATNTDKITNIAMPVIEGTVDQAGPLTVTIYSDAALTMVIGQGNTDASGHFAIAINAGADQLNKTIFVVARNATRTSNVAQFQFTLDTTPPAPTSLVMSVASDTGPSNTDHYTSVTRPVFQGIAEPSALIRIFIQPQGGTRTLLTKFVANSSGSWLFTVPNPLADGTYIVTAIQTDVAGNTQTVVSQLTPNLTIDTTPPAAPAFNLTPASDTGVSQTDHITNRNRPDFMAVAPLTPAEAGSTVRIFQQRVVNGTPTGTPVAIATGTVQSDGSWTATFSGTALVDGTYRITGQLIDLAGNVGVLGQMNGPDLVVVTAKPPSPGKPALSPADDSNVKGDNITNVTTPHFIGAGSPGAMVQIFVRLLPNGTATAAGQGTVPAGSTTYNVQVSAPLADGTYEVTAVQTDVAGNVSVPSPPLTGLVIDTTVLPPTVNLSPASDSGLSNSDHVTNITTPTFVGTGEVGAAVLVSIRRASDNALVQTLNATVGSNGTFAATVPATGNPPRGLADGTYQVTATQTDVAGNVSTPSAPVNPPVTIDTVPPGGGVSGTAPSVPVLPPSDDTGVSNSDHVTRVTLPHFTGTGEPGAQVRIFATLGANEYLIGFAFVDGAGNYNVSSLSPLGSATFQITADQVDAAGNVSPRSAAMVPPLTIDAIPPATPTLVLDPNSDTGVRGDNTTASIPQQFDGTAEPGSRVDILDGGAVIDSFTQVATTNAFTRTLNLANGSHVLTVQSTDTAGNTSTSAPMNVIIDPNALDADRKYIRSLYQEELGRAGSLAEWSGWLGLLATPNGRANVASGIARSPEARQRLVNNWYLTYLGRPAQGNEPWVPALLAGATEEQVLAQILGSPEFFGRAPSFPGVGGGAATNQTFVRSLYVLLLQRQPGASEVNFWVGQIPTLGRAGVAQAILGSIEYRRLVVNGYYTNLLGRTQPPSQGEVDGWAFSGLDITSIRIGFLSSLEYFNHVSA
jgi:subtilisin-like proprotein convertase family protein